MPTKLTKAKLHAMGIRNPHNIASQGPRPQVVIDYYPQDLGRGGHGAKWKVFEIGVQTDPTAPWYEHGNKAFYPRYPLNKENKDACRDAAMAWAAERYGIKEWERSPFGSYHPKGTLASLQGEMVSE